MVSRGSSSARSTRAVISAPIHVEAAVHRADDEVESLQHLRRVVECAVLEDVRFHPLEHADPIETRIDRVYLGPLALEVIGAQPAGICRRLAVIRDADVAVALFPAGERQLLNRVGAVAVVGVAVQEPGEVGRSSSRGSAPRAARTISSRPSRSSGGTSCSPSAP